MSYKDDMIHCNIFKDISKSKKGLLLSKILKLYKQHGREKVIRAIKILLDDMSVMVGDDMLIKRADTRNWKNRYKSRGGGVK